MTTEYKISTKTPDGFYGIVSGKTPMAALRKLGAPLQDVVPCDYIDELGVKTYGHIFRAGRSAEFMSWEEQQKAGI